MGIALVKGFYVRLVMTLLVITLVTCIMKLGMHERDVFLVNRGSFINHVDNFLDIFTPIFVNKFALKS